MRRVFSLEKRGKSFTAYFCLVFILCLSAFLFDVFHGLYGTGMPHSFSRSDMSSFLGRPVSAHTLGLINALWRLIAYGAMGLYLFFKTGFKEIINDDIRQPKNILVVILAGLIMGLFFIGYDSVYRNARGYPILLYYDSTLPSAIFASIAEGIGDQIFNMIRLYFLVWLFSKAIRSEEGRAKLFWVVAVLCALMFAVEHIPYTMIFSAGRYRSVFHVRPWEFWVIMGLYAPLAFVCTCFLKKYGLLGAIIVHTVCDLTWRVAWAWIRLGGDIFA